MKSADEILKEVTFIMDSNWNVRTGRDVPDLESLRLNNDDAIEIEGAVLYADMRGSTNLVQKHTDKFAAKMYKVFLRIASNVVRNNNGVITSFDGDRIMAVFYGNSKCSDAAKTGLQLNAVIRDCNEKLIKRKFATNYQINYAVGVDVSKLFVVRTGIRGANDLAWIGTAANNAAKLSELRSYEEKTFITQRVFTRLATPSKYSANGGRCMWNELDMKIMGETIFGSSWFWSF